MTQRTANRVGMRLLAITILAIALILVVAAHNAFGYSYDTDDQHPDELDFTEQVCQPPPVDLVHPEPEDPLPDLPRHPNAFGAQRPPVIPGMPPIKIQTGVILTKANVRSFIKQARAEGWNIGSWQGYVWCDDVFATDKNNGRWKWHVMGYAGGGSGTRVREWWTPCELEAPSFPNALHPGHLACRKKWYAQDY